MPVLCVSASRAVEQGRAPHGRIPVQGSGDNYELWGQVCYHTFPLKSHNDGGDDDDGFNYYRGTTGPTTL